MGKTFKVFGITVLKIKKGFLVQTSDLKKSDKIFNYLKLEGFCDRHEDKFIRY